MLSKILRSPYFTWFLLAIPSFSMLSSYIGGTATAHGLLHPSGEFSARAMLLALSCTPLVILFPKVRVFRSLLKRRRYIGVAAFGYAMLHTGFYVIDRADVSFVFAEMLELSIWTGWIAFLIFIPLALTSNDAAVRRLGRKWKKLQRWVYAAAVLTAAHWLFLEYEIGPMLVHFVPLVALETARVAKTRVKMEPKPV